jgi:hypothetical protein
VRLFSFGTQPLWLEFDQLNLTNDTGVHCIFAALSQKRLIGVELAGSGLQDF